MLNKHWVPFVEMTVYVVYIFIYVHGVYMFIYINEGFSKNSGNCIQMLKVLLAS